MVKNATTPAALVMVLVAARAIFVDGKPFQPNDLIENVAPDQAAIAKQSGAAVEMSEEDYLALVAARDDADAERARKEAEDAAAAEAAAKAEKDAAEAAAKAAKTPPPP